MSYWYSGTYVVITGWRHPQLSDLEIDGLLTSPKTGPRNPQGKDRRPLWGTIDEIREDIGRYAEAGLTELFLEGNFTPGGAAIEQALEVMARLAPGG
jgi:hypothetical protein